MANKRVEKIAAEIALARDESPDELRNYIVRQLAFLATIDDPGCGEWDWISLKIGTTKARAKALIVWAKEG